MVYSNIRSKESIFIKSDQMYIDMKSLLTLGQEKKLSPEASLLIQLAYVFYGSVQGDHPRW